MQRVVMIGLVVLGAACGAAPPPRIIRVVGGERRVGAFVSPYAYEHFIRGELARAMGDLETAAEELTLARAGPEEDPLVLARLAEVLDQLGRREDSDEVLSEAIELFPRAESIWLAAGRIAQRRDDWQNAVANYRAAARVAPSSAQGPLALFHLLRERGADARAEALLKRFLKRTRKASAGALRAQLELALARDDGQGAVNAVEALLRVAPARMDEVRRAAQVAYDSGRSFLAAELLDAIPESPGDAVLRVKALLGAGRTSEAEAFLVSHSPKTFGGLVAQAELMLLAGRADRALELADLARLRGSQPRAHLVAGRALLALGQYDTAAVELSKVPRGVGGHSEAMVALSRALEAHGLASLGSEVLSRALDEPTDRPAVLRAELSRSRIEQGDPEGALALYEGQKGGHDRAVYASLLEQVGRPRDAARVYASLPPDARELPPGSVARGEAERLVRSGELTEAIAVLDDQIAKDPMDLFTRARLAELLERVGRVDEARDVVRETVHLSRDSTLTARLRAVGGI